MKLAVKKGAALKVLLGLALVLAFSSSAIGVSAANSVTIQLNPFPTSKATGNGVVTDNGDGTITVVITVKGLEPGTHINHIHTGSCAAQGPVKYPLSDLTVDANGNATNTTKVAVSFAAVTAGGFYLNVHDLAKASATCGDIVLNAAASGSTSGQGGGTGVPATGLGGAAVNSDNGFPFGLALIGILSLVVLGSGLALVRSGKSRD